MGSYWTVDDDEFVSGRHLKRGRPRKYDEKTKTKRTESRGRGKMEIIGNQHSPQTPFFRNSQIAFPINQQTPYDQARALMLSSAYSNMIHANMSISPSNPNANMIVPPSVSNANIVVTPSVSNASFAVSQPISNATFSNAYSTIPQNFQGTRQNKDFLNYYNAMIGLRNAANWTVPLLKDPEKFNSK